MISDRNFVDENSVEEDDESLLNSNPPKPETYSHLRPILLPFQPALLPPRVQRGSNMLLRFGKRGGLSNMYLRSGRAPNMLLRTGKRSFEEDVDDNKIDEKVKRAQNMLLRAGKRSDMLLRAGRGENSMFLRAGKSGMGNMYLRSGKRSHDEDGDALLRDLRSSMYLRAGKRSADIPTQYPLKRAGSMYLRAGKRAGSSMLLRAGKRAENSMFLRAGKRPSNGMYLRTG